MWEFPCRVFCCWWTVLCNGHRLARSTRPTRAVCCFWTRQCIFIRFSSGRYHGRFCWNLWTSLRIFTSLRLIPQSPRFCCFSTPRSMKVYLRSSNAHCRSFGPQAIPRRKSSRWAIRICLYRFSCCPDNAPGTNSRQGKFNTLTHALLRTRTGPRTPSLICIE